MLDIESVSKVFVSDRRQSENVALSSISLSFPEGQFVTLLGPSGCGKSTLLKIVAGLIVPDEGTVRFEGQEVRGPGIERSMVFQDYGLLPWRTVLGNVEFGLEMHGVSAAERRPRSLHEIERVGLAGFEGHFPNELSGGMRQRVALARCLVKESKVLLMDEPFAAADMLTREYLQDELLRILGPSRSTVLFVTHGIDEAIYLGDRVIVMSARPGKVQADIMIDLPRPRYEGDTKSLARFGELRRLVRDALARGGSAIGDARP
jgi:NitT/TauT family transport system ATP-binding protein